MTLRSIGIVAGVVSAAAAIWGKVEVSTDETVENVALGEPVPHARARSELPTLFWEVNFVLIALALSASAQTIARYRPITPEGRLRWLSLGTAGPTSLAGGLFSSGWGTLFDKPPEYGPHWEGFGKRYAMRLTGVATGNVMEAGLGCLWGEDPRHFRAAGRPFKSRVWNVIKGTFTAPNRNGVYRPAYARYAAIASNNFLSNAWRADGEATVPDAALRTLSGFLGRMGAEAFAEFWPDIRRRLPGRKKRSGP